MEVESQTITEIASQLGLAAERIFGIFVVAQPIVAVIKALILIGIILTIVLIYRYMNKITDEADIEVIYGTVIISFLVLILLGAVVHDITTAIFLPEYSAARELIYLLKP